MRFEAFDRLAGRRVELPSGAIVASCYQLLPSASDVSHNSFPAVEGTFVVSDIDGRWRAIRGSDVVAGTILRSQLPDPRGDARGVMILGRRIEEEIGAGASWAEIAAISPIEPDLSIRAELLQFEIRLRDNVGFLEDVCARPRVQLNTDTERVPVSLARRTAPQAPNFLASHAEDWERLTLRSVLPRRILALVRHDDYDIYENRVAVRLVDHLVAYLDERTREVAHLARVFEEARDFNTEVGAGTFWRRNRLFHLWGDVTDADEAFETAKRTLNALQHLPRRINTLKDSVLYREVPRRADVGASLQVTNILADDARYRRVADIWRDWSRNARDVALRPRERFEQAQELNRLFNRYAFLLAVRALEQLGFRPASPSAGLVGKTLDLSGPPGRFRLKWSDHTGVITLVSGAEKVLRIVPLCSYLPMLDDELLAEVVDACDRSNTTLVVYPTPPAVTEQGDTEASVRARLHELGHEVGHGTDRRAGFAPVSPRDIGSLERVARHVRWATLAPLFMAYPPRIEGDEVPEAVEGGPWIETAKDAVLLLGLPPEEALSAIQAEAADAAAGVEQLRAERDRLAGEISRAQRAGRSATDLAARKRAVDGDLPAAEKRAAAIARFRDGLEPALPMLESLLECPICGEQVDRRKDFHGGPGRRFSAACPKCAAKWSTNRCATCSEWIPVLVPHHKVAELSKGPPLIGWVDRMFGADVLASPRLVQGQLRYVCPTCGSLAS